MQGLVLCATIALHCTGIALYCTGIVQGLGCALCIPHLMISCGSASPSIRKLQYEVTIAIAWLSHFLLEQLSLQTSLFSFLLLYPYPSMVGIFVVIRLSVGLCALSGCLPLCWYFIDEYYVMKSSEAIWNHQARVRIVLVWGWWSVFGVVGVAGFG